MLTWVKGLKCYENGDIEGAFKCFEQINPSSKTMFNVGCIMMKLGRLDQAIAFLTRALEYDQFFSLAYFVRSVCLYELDIIDEALCDVNDSIRYLRGNLYIDYTQLGLKYKLHSSVVYFNRGIYLSRLGQDSEATATLKEAARLAENIEDVDLRPISQVLRVKRGMYHEQLNLYVFPCDKLFCPPAEKILNADRKQYVPKAQVVAAENPNDSYAGFSGRELNLSKTSLARKGMDAAASRGDTDRQTQSSGPGSLSLPIKDFSDATAQKPKIAESLRSIPFANIPRQQTSIARNMGEESDSKGSNADAIEDILNDKVYKSQDYPPRNPQNPPAGSYKTAPRKQIVKVKLHKGQDLQMLTTATDTPFDDFKEKIKNKIGADENIVLQYKDEDGDMINMCDDEGYSLALQSARGTPGNTKIELWCR